MVVRLLVIANGPGYLYALLIETNKQRPDLISLSLSVAIDNQLQNQAGEWITAVSKQKLTSFQEDLKSGVVLCKYA